MGRSASLATVGIGPIVRLRAAVAMQVDPHALILAVRDEDGRIVDFEYMDGNQAPL